MCNCACANSTYTEASLPASTYTSSKSLLHKPSPDTSVFNVYKALYTVLLYDPCSCNACVSEEPLRRILQYFPFSFSPSSSIFVHSYIHYSFLCLFITLFYFQIYLLLSILNLSTSFFSQRFSLLFLYLPLSFHPPHAPTLSPISVLLLIIPHQLFSTTSISSFPT
jgi:hypothetical protein